MSTIRFFRQLNNRQIPITFCIFIVKFYNTTIDGSVFTKNNNFFIIYYLFVLQNILVCHEDDKN